MLKHTPKPTQLKPKLRNSETADLAKQALGLLALLTAEEKKVISREIGKGFRDEMNRVNRLSKQSLC